MTDPNTRSKQPRNSALSVRVIIVLFGLVAITHGLCFATTAKELYREGERLLKLKDSFGAYKVLFEAVKLEPKNKKYQKLLDESGREASDACLTEAQAQISTDARLAHERLKWAVEYNPQNTVAASLLSSLEADIGQAKRRIGNQRQTMDLDQIDTASATLQELKRYKHLLPEYSLLESEISWTRRLAEARTALHRGEPLVSARLLSSKTQDSTEVNHALRIAENNLRGDTLSDAVAKYESSRPGTLMRARAAFVLQSVSDELAAKDHANGARIEFLTFLGNIEKHKLPHGDTLGDHPRLLLQVLHALSQGAGTNHEQHLDTIAKKLKALPKRNIRLLLRGPAKPNCNSLPENLFRVAAKTLEWVTEVTNEDYDVAFNISDLSCQATINPRASETLVNSTYVAGQSQAVNPTYVQLKANLDAAQIELAKAELAENNAFLIGLHRGTVWGLQRRLSQTSPFVYQDIEQAYQFTEFLAKRRFYIRASGSLLTRGGNVHGGREFLIEAERSSEGQGRAGTLPQDRTYSNQEPELQSLEDLRTGAVDEFTAVFLKQLKQALCDSLMIRALDESLPELVRLDTLLQLVDRSEDTSYAEHRPVLLSVVEGRLFENAERSSPLIIPASVQRPEANQKFAASQTRDSSAEDVSVMIDRVLDGVVAIETDTGSTASGFFVSKDCHVLTNHHVIAGSNVVIVKDRRKRIYVGELSGAEADTDLALIRTKSGECRPLGLERAPSVKIADEVFAVGSPLGLTGTVTKGIISGIRQLTAGSNLFQIDAALNPGNSGGPLVDKNGRVVGINTFKLKGYENLNFAVSIAEAFRIFGGMLTGH